MKAKFNIEKVILITFSLYFCCSGYTVKKKIFGGWPAKIQEFPYHVLLEERILPLPLGPWQRVCGGSILAKRWVLTSAKCHKWLGSEMIDFPRVVVGVDRIHIWENESFIYDIEKFIANPYFQQTNRNFYDIALIRLKQPIIFSSTVQPISLPGEEEDKDYDVGLILGFGHTTPSEWIGPNHLRGTNVKIIRGIQCENALAQSYNLRIELCGQWTAGEGPCTYDTGGALANIREDGDFVAIGIITELQGVCGTKQIIRYTRVGAMLDWIIDVVSRFPDGIPSLDMRP